MGCCSSNLVQQSLISQGTLNEKYEVDERVLGTGAFAVVKLCRLRETKEARALKIIMKDARTHLPNISALLNAEIQIMRSHGFHPNILATYDVYETQTAVFIVMEYAAGGDLLSVIEKRGVITEVDAARIIRQIGGAIAYLHSASIVHRDVKLENLLVTDSRLLLVKLCDFGLSKILPKSASAAPGELEAQMRSAVGTSGYMAPELLQLMARARAHAR